MNPRAVVLVHGAGSGPWVFDGWDVSFPAAEVVAIDLHEALDVACATHDDYTAAVERAARPLPRPVVLLGWSMGGLVVMTAAASVRPDALVLVDSSPPAEVQGFDRDVKLVDGTFDPEDVYGSFPDGVQARPESLRARGERKRGISVPTLAAPVLVVASGEFAEERGTKIAARYGARLLSFPTLSHWELVQDERVRAAVADAVAEL